ncbi:MAG: FAD-dependent oxidoreductase [Lachnospiraceae bacterium]|nr:FAD-dependent oxidoreductase [Lachnospiraceae bacterium]
MKNTVSRRDFMKGMAASAAGIAALGAGRMPRVLADGETLAYIPGTYTSTQSTPYATVNINCTFSENALTDVTYEVVKTSSADYFNQLGFLMDNYCKRIVEAGGVDGVDGVASASLSSKAIEDGVNACRIMALGLELPEQQEKTVLNPQDENFTSFESDLAEVFSPIQLGGMTLPNRTIKSAGSGTWKDQNGDGLPVACEVYGTMAANGVSLILLPNGVVSGFGVLPTSLTPKNGTVEEGLANAKILTDTIHEAGGKLGFQLCFGGGAPSYPDSLINDTPVEELDKFIENVGISAERAKQTGFDCIEIKGASADALNGFLTRRVNRREDEYGPQSIENRTRLFCRTIQKIKEVNGADYPVGALINGVEENDASLGDNDLFLTIEETKEIAKALVAAGADWIQLRVGANGQEMNIWAPDVQHIVKDADGITGFGTMFDYSQHFEGMIDGSHSGFASFLPMVKEIKKVVDVPVGCAAYMDLRVGPDFINDAIARGDLDLVFMNRPLNCDPELVKKMQEGRREDVIPCMKCMHCHDNNSTGRRYPSMCRMNAASYNSLTKTMPDGAKLQPAETPRNIMVIGAGPAGMEAARVAAERGHKVSLYEATDKLGGLIPFARGVKGNHEHFDDYLTYISHQLEKNGVDVHFFSPMELEDVQEAKPDAVVVAVGGARESKLTGTDAVPVLSPTEAFGSGRLGDTVAILGAGVQAVDFAASLVTQGKKVVMIHSDSADNVDKGQAGWFKIYTVSYLKSKGVRIWSDAEILSVSDEGVTFLTDAGLEKTVACDSVVEFYNMVPNTELAEELEKAGFEVYTAGDCADPHNIQRAVLSGNLIGRKI